MNTVIDVNDPWKAKTVLMNHETTWNTYVRALISLEATSITCKKKIESWKKSELVIMSGGFKTILRQRRHVPSKHKAYPR